MKKGDFNSMVVAILLIFTLLVSCGKTPTPTLAPTSTSIPTEAPTSTVTLEPTSTNTPAPTSIPGAIVIPMSSLAKRNPWLPFDEQNRPMSVYYGFFMNKPPFNNVLVRQAFAYAVDKDEIAAKATSYSYQNVTPATTLTPPEVLGRDLYGEVGILYNPTKAKELLAQAGYTDVTKFPEVTLMVSNRGEAYPGAYYQMALMIAEMWKANLGVIVTVKQGANMPSYLASLENDEADIYQLGWGADKIDPDDFLNSLLHSSSSYNYGHYDNSDFDQLVEQAARLSDPAERQILYIQAERILTEQDAGIIPLFHTLYYKEP